MVPTSIAIELSVEVLKHKNGGLYLCYCATANGVTGMGYTPLEALQNLDRDLYNDLCAE